MLIKLESYHACASQINGVVGGRWRGARISADSTGTLQSIAALQRVKSVLYVRPLYVL